MKNNELKKIFIKKNLIYEKIIPIFFKKWIKNQLRKYPKKYEYKKFIKKNGNKKRIHTYNINKQYIRNMKKILIKYENNRKWYKYNCH